MALTTDQRVNMSLDDVIAKNAKKIANRRQSKGNASTGSNNAKKAPAPSAKVAKSVGAAKAKRSAKVDQRRGLNNTGKATKTQVQGAIQRAGEKKRRPNSAGSAASGLKISFKPKELKQTTDRVVVQQINAVLSKQPAPKKNNSNNHNNDNSNNSTPRAPKKRSVILSPASGGSNRSAQGNPKRRANPKQQKKTTIRK